MKISEMSVELIDSMGSDQSVCNAARVSFAKDAANYTEEQNNKLLDYLARHNHWSPYAHAFLSFRIKVPMFVAMQLDKHVVGLVTNSVSRRYVDDEPEFWFPEQWRGKPINAKQGSSDEEVTTLKYLGPIKKAVPATLVYMLDLYNNMIKEGVAPEQARMVLPMNIMMERIWSGSLMAFARVVKLRTDSHAQLECQEVAKKLNDLIPQEFKYSWQALMNN